MDELLREARAWVAWAEDAGVRILAPSPVPRPGPDPMPDPAPRPPPSPQPIPEPKPTMKLKTLQAVVDEIGECTRCKLHKGRNHIVFGVGSAQARLMFVGEAPGEDEDQTGEPFVG